MMAKQLNRDAIPYEPNTRLIKAPPPAVAILVSPPPLIPYYYYFTHQPFYHNKSEFANFCSYSLKSQPKSYPVSVQPTGGQYAAVLCGGDKKVMETYKASWENKRKNHCPKKFLTGGKRWSRKCLAQWKPKLCKSACSAGAGGGFKTTVMIKNIPNQLRRNMLIEFLDELCDEHQLEYDFVYLPMDFVRQNNFGYAFVNFTSAKAAWRIKELLEGYRWERIKTDYGIFLSHKVCQITWAKIQGRDALIGNFENSAFVCDKTEWLPVVFAPPRSGSCSNCKQLIIGKCRAPNSSCGSI